MSDLTLRERWIEALRSGEYERTISMLRHESNKFCCLGVLCDISNLGTWEPAEDKEYYRYTIDTARSAATLLYMIVDSIGATGATVPFDIEKISNETVRKEIYSIPGVVDSCSLTTLNDSGFTFEQIADLLENEPQAFFLGEE